MSLSYHLYKNDGLGGPIDFATIVATTAALTYTPANPAWPSDNQWAVKAFDTVSGLESLDPSATTRLILDAAGDDVTAAPNPPRGLLVRAVAGNKLRCSWHYDPTGQRGAPTAFRVYVGAAGGGAPDYTLPPAQTVPATSGVLPRLLEPRNFSIDLAGLTAGSLYAIGVRSVAGTIEEPNTATASGTPSGTGPSAPDAIGATVGL